MKKNIAIILIVFCLGGFVFWVVKNKQVTSKNVSPEKLQVVASFYPLSFFASSIGGDIAEVVNLMPVGTEPHDYEPTPGDLVKMEKSALIALNGGGLESWQSNLEKNIDLQKTKIVVAGEGLLTRQISEKGASKTDPHIWLDLVLAEKMVDKIVQGFGEVDAQNKDYYFSNATELKNKLRQLDGEYRQGLKNCQKRDIITSHSAFSYLASEYSLNQVPIAGLSPDAEPSPSQLASIVKFARDNDVKYIFFESLASPKLAETLAREIGAQTLVLDPLEGLSQLDAAQGKNYITVMQDNLKNLKTALECQ